MNVLFVSPGYPPSQAHFVTALAQRGASVLGVGDTPPAALAPALRHALADYVHVADLERYDDVHRAAALSIHRHGRIDHVASLNEHWLPLEARLREDFNVEGLRPRELRAGRSKSTMAEVFAREKIPTPEGAFVHEPEALRAFARAHGYPLMLKPDVGCGAERAMRIDDEAQLEAALATGLSGYVVQRFVQAPMTSFDGLVDRDGRIVHAASFHYGDGVFETLRDGRDVWLYTRRELPPALDALGRSVVRAFGLRASFFHIEAFELAPDRYLALEINLRPPGGFLIDTMNYACDVDLFGLWADVVTYRDASAVAHERGYHAAHVGRRRRPYALAPADAVAALGDAVCAVPPVPAGLGESMGDPIFLVRHRDEAGIRRAIATLLAPAESAQ